MLFAGAGATLPRVILKLRQVMKIVNIIIRVRVKTCLYMWRQKVATGNGHTVLSKTWTEKAGNTMVCEM